MDIHEKTFYVATKATLVVRELLWACHPENPDWSEKAILNALDELRAVGDDVERVDAAVGEVWILAHGGDIARWGTYQAGSFLRVVAQLTADLCHAVSKADPTIDALYRAASWIVGDMCFADGGFAELDARLDAEYALVRAALSRNAPTQASDNGGERRGSLDSRALAIFLADRALTKNQIADRLGASKQSLTPQRCPQLATAMRVWHSQNAMRLPRGRKGKDGDMEAYSEE